MENSVIYRYTVRRMGNGYGVFDCREGRFIMTDMGYGDAMILAAELERVVLK